VKQQKGQKNTFGYEKFSEKRPKEKTQRKGPEKSPRGRLGLKASLKRELKKS
jgi:hypothetical protein